MRNSSFHLVSSLFLGLTSLSYGAETIAPYCNGSSPIPDRFQALRVRSSCEFKDSILKGYASVYQKEQRIRRADGSPFRAAPHLDGCITREVEIRDPETPNTRLEWFDRARSCAAEFQDTHLELQSFETQPWISLGFSLRELNGRYYIESSYPRLLAARLAPTEAALFVAGSEVLTIQGRPVSELQKEMMAYVSGSSPEYRRAEALKRLTERNFKFPEATQTSLTFASGPTVTMDWRADFVSPQDPQSLQALQARGFQHAPEMPWLRPAALDENLLKLPEYSGFYEETPAVPESAQTRMAHFWGIYDAAPALGFVRVDSRSDGVEQSYCYLQLASFAEDRVVGDKGKAKPYSGPLRKFLRHCQKDSLPLVLDLRSNSGGYIDLGSEAFSALLPKRSRASARATWAYRESEIYREIGDGYFDGQYWAENSVEISPREKSDRKVRGFSGYILGLITPYCISSCDRLAALLKASRRATLLGTPTNGTGAGFMDVTDPTTGKLRSDWQDSSQTLFAQIPDMLFGAIPSQEIPLSSGRPSGFGGWVRWLLDGKPEATNYVPMEAYEELALLENRPTVPDFGFQMTASDLQKGAQSWVREIQKALSPAGLP